MRLAGLLWGVLFVAWLPIEDQTPIPALLLAAGLVLWLLARHWSTPGRDRPALYFLGSTAGAGLALSPLAALLVLFKSGLHAHGTTDLPPEQLAALLRQAPLWGAAGFLLGAGFRLVESSRKPDGLAPPAGE